ncbi:hypothetical protein DFP73DRAFT_593588 [Morchella snyderi]|nr:hypothetical protein DFP73DRAFT_593588 [Morchella snyderi]
MTRPLTNNSENAQPIGRAVQSDNPLVLHGDNVHPENPMELSEHNPTALNTLDYNLNQLSFPLGNTEDKPDQNIVLPSREELPIAQRTSERPAEVPMSSNQVGGSLDEIKWKNRIPFTIDIPKAVRLMLQAPEGSWFSSCDFCVNADNIHNPGAIIVLKSKTISACYKLVKDCKEALEIPNDWRIFVNQENSYYKRCESCNKDLDRSMAVKVFVHHYREGELENGNLLVDNISLQNIEPVLRCNTENSETYVKYTIIVTMSVKTKTVSANFIVTSSIKSYKPINTGINGSSKHKRMFKKRDFKSIDRATELTDASRLNKSPY